MKLHMPQWQQIMAVIEKYEYGSDMARHIGITYNHIVHLLQTFENKGWVTTQKVGRIKRITVTPDGKLVSLYCQQVKRFSE